MYILQRSSQHLTEGDIIIIIFYFLLVDEKLDKMSHKSYPTVLTGLVAKSTDTKQILSHRIFYLQNPT